MTRYRMLAFAIAALCAGAAIAAAPAMVGSSAPAPSTGLMLGCACLLLTTMQRR